MCIIILDIIMFALLFYLIKGITRLTGMKMEEILKAGERLEDIAENNPEVNDSSETDSDSETDKTDTEKK